LSPLLVGLSTALGGIIVITFGKPSFARLGHMLSFSSGVMLFISFADLMPEAINQVGFGVANLAVRFATYTCIVVCKIFDLTKTIVFQ
jgi:zinc transporter ZupT